jgi:rhodanese-related sulfurtransferase
VADLSPQQVSELLSSGADVQLIDVREPDEHAAGRIAGAQLIPLATLTGAADSLRRDAPLVFVCRSGARSAMATDAFAGAGYEAFNLEGGLQAWAATGLPLEPEDGRVA